MNAHASLKSWNRPRAFDPHLADAWRGSYLELNEHILFIKQHCKTIAEKDEMILPRVRRHRVDTVEQAERLLAYRCPLYLDALRRVMACEAKMDAIGMPYAKCSYAWEGAA